MNATAKEYVIRSELGTMTIDAESVEDAKQEYQDATGFDFDGFADYPGSWYWIDENGVKIEDETENMP